MKAPAPLGENWKHWGEKLKNYLDMRGRLLEYITSGESADIDGVLMWDRTSGHPVVSFSDEFLPLAYGYNAHGMFTDTTDHAPTAINTAYALTWNTDAGSDNVSINGIDSSKIDFAVDGRFIISFSAQITSNNSAAKNVWFWPRVNGTDVSGFTMQTTITNNSDTVVVSRTGIFNVSSGDYLQAMYAADNTNITIDTMPASAFAPLAPSITLSVAEIDAS